MDTQHKYTVEEVLEIHNFLELKEREILKSKLLTEELAFERLVRRFAKYDATFKALS